MTDQGQGHEANMWARWRPTPEDWTAYSWQMFHLNVVIFAVVITSLTLLL